MKLDKSPIRMEFLRKKLKWIQQAMREQEIDIWITFTREGNEDPLAQDLRFSDLTWRSAAIIDQDGMKTAVVGSLEVETIKQNKFYDEVVGYASEMTNMFSTEPPTLAPVLPHARPNAQMSATANVSATAVARL